MAVKDTVTRILITAKDETQSAFRSLQARAAGVAAAVAGYFSARLFGDSVEKAEALDVGMRKLRATIIATGGAAGLTAEEIDQMARRLDEATLGSATGFRAAANALLTFKSIGRDSFETVLSLAADLEAAGFGNLEANAVQLGKALEDPVKGLTALTRSGVSFTAEQQNVIKTLVETGRAAEAQGIILDAVAGQVGGVAAAAGQGLSGVRDLIGKITTDIQEAFGTKLLPALTELQTKFAGFLASVRDSGAVEKLGDAIAYVATRIDKLVTLIAVGVGVRATAGLKAFTLATTASGAAAGISAAAAGAYAATLNLLAAAGARATAALILLTRAAPWLAVGSAIAFVASKLFSTKENAEEAAVATEDLTTKTTEGFKESVVAAEALRAKLSDVQAQFIKLTAEGKTAVEALKQISSAADISSADGITSLLNDMQELRNSALATGDQIQSSLTERLSKLSGTELREFGIQAEIAFNRGEIAAEQLAEALEARVSAAAKNLGVDLDLLTDGISSGFAEASENLNIVIEALGEIKEAGGDAAAALEAAISGAIAAAKNTEDLERLAEVVRSLGVNGQLAESRVTAMLDAIRQKSDQVTPGINSISEALKELGITSDAELKKTADRFEAAYKAVVQMGGSIREQKEAFSAYAQAAIAANDGVASAALQAEASMLGLKVEADEAGKAIVKSMGEAADETERISEAADSAKESIKEVATATEKLSESVEKQKTAVAGTRVVWLDAARAASAYADEAGRAAEAAQEAFQVNNIRGLDFALQSAQAAAREYVDTMERLDAQQRQITDTSTSGVDQLRLRLLELTGTEAEIARAREEQARAERQDQIAILQIEIERARLRGDTDAAEESERRIRALKQELVLLEQIFKAERSRGRERSGGSSSGGSSGGAAISPSQAPAGASRGPVSIVINDARDPEKVARQVKKELDKIQRFAR